MMMMPNLLMINYDGVNELKLTGRRSSSIILTFWHCSDRFTDLFFLGGLDMQS